MADFSMSFAPETLKEITQMLGFPALLSPEMQIAMQQDAAIVVQAAQDNADARFANPTGQLRDAIVPVQDSPYEVQVQVQVPYGHRRDQGFVGADSRGRMYNDQGFYYLTDAMTSTPDQILQVMNDMLSRAMAKIGGQ
jgi:hypothetical protein